jgi:site-specific recombinase XerC
LPPNPVAGLPTQVLNDKGRYHSLWTVRCEDPVGWSAWLSAATINLHLSAIRRLADEAAESGWLSSKLAIGVRRVKGVKRLGRRLGNWLTGDQAQELLNAVSQSTMRGRRDAALIGLLLGCGLRRSEAVNRKRLTNPPVRIAGCVL